MPRLARTERSSGALPHRVRGKLLTPAAALLLATGPIGCGVASGGTTSTSSSPVNSVVVRVGDVAIDREEVAHLASTIRRSNSIATVFGQTSGTERQRALGFLISANWVIGRAAEEGLSISGDAVERRLREKVAAFPNGRSEFDEELSSTGQTLADVKLEVKAALAVAALRSAVAQHLSVVSDADISIYYAHHRRRFYLPARRVAYLIEGIHDYARAVTLARQVKPGVRLTKPWYREIVSSGPGEGDYEKIAHMIFATAPGRSTTPTYVTNGWVLAAVEKLIPAGIQPLAVVRGDVLETLLAQHREQFLKRSAAAFVRKWTARTSCSPGYVVQKCSEYRGALATEVALLKGE
jgi:hypothetical protein